MFPPLAVKDICLAYAGNRLAADSAVPQWLSHCKWGWGYRLRTQLPWLLDRLSMATDPQACTMPCLCQSPQPTEAQDMTQAEECQEPHKPSHISHPDACSQCFTAHYMEMQHSNSWDYRV